jgi:hypothetical protein
MACVAALAASPALLPFPSTASASCSCRLRLRLRPAVVARAPRQQQPRGRRALRRFDEVRCVLACRCLACPPLASTGRASVECASLTDVRLLSGLGAPCRACRWRGCRRSGAASEEELAALRGRRRRRRREETGGSPLTSRSLRSEAHRIALFCLVNRLHTACCGVLSIENEVPTIFSIQWDEICPPTSASGDARSGGCQLAKWMHIYSMLGSAPLRYCFNIDCHAYVTIWYTTLHHILLRLYAGSGLGSSLLKLETINLNFSILDLSQSVCQLLIQSESPMMVFIYIS